MLASFDLPISHSQVTVYLPSVERPGHLWEEAHLQQGFAWSPGIASFGVPEHADVCLVQVDRLPKYAMAHEAISSVCVPFDVTENPVQIGSVFFAEDVQVELGHYDLIFEACPGIGSWTMENDGIEERVDYSYTLNIWFVPRRERRFRIIRRGGAVLSDRVLRETAGLA